MKNEQEIVRSVFDAYIRDAKATSTKKDRPTFDMLEKVKNRAIKALEQQPSEDCVSRQAVIDMTGLSKWFESSDDYNSFIEDLCKLPPVTPTQKWIPVSERLPKIGEKVLCQCQANIYDVLKLTVDGWYYDKNHCYMSGFVIAWQPLPQPYEEKRGNEK